MYLQGNPFELGVVNGKLSHDLIEEQEEAFVAQIRKLVPSPSYLKFLKYFTYWFNRDLDRNIPEEYLQEIYGISLSASDKFNYIGTPYHRMMNYHSAHDIGHALQDLALVGCTSFGVWDGRSADSSLIIGRNFDFYMGEEFAKNKIVCFVKPDSGQPFMMVTWAGMIGTVSGMNMSGLTVTINAAKSDVPWSAKTPISLLAREILQYARTIKEAYAIALKARNLRVGIDPHRFGLRPPGSHHRKVPFTESTLLSPADDQIICSNHYQGAAFATDPLNRKNMEESASLYRYRRMQQLLDAGGSR